jgi:hypothetical protein
MNKILVAALIVAAGCEAAPTIPVIIHTGDMSVPAGDGGTRDLSMGGGPCGPCPAERPKCDPVAKMCVSCLGDRDCDPGMTCQMGACMPGCNAVHPCGMNSVCDVDAGVCRSCFTDKDCKDKSKPVCDSVTGHCAACSPAADKCPDGQYCDLNGGNPACKMGCKSAGDCIQFGIAGQCCNHLCTDTSASADNCGACGMGCGGKACCSSVCVDLMADAKNCSACGMVCGGLNTVPTCTAGMCTIGACAMGFGDCNMDPKDGCETSTGFDVKNCGKCGNVCSVPNATPLCLNGACVIGQCMMGFKDCNGDPKDGCESNTKVDSVNCGACGQNCANTPHATAACQDGMCGIGKCDPGYADCDRNANNGCESQLLADPDNCNACGNKCPRPNHIAAVCNNGVCGLGQCENGWSDCDKNPNNGCEAQLSSDVNNCGLCGKVCFQGAPNAAPGCVNGGCSFACNQGFADCNGVAQDGCEVNLNSDAMNCGMCNVACVMNGKMGQCQAAKCTYGPACSNGSYVDCNPNGTTLLQGSAFVDSNVLNGWTQCAGFVNTAGDDVSPGFLDNCLNTGQLRIRVYNGNNIEEDIIVTGQSVLNAWPNWNYLGGNFNPQARTNWGGTSYFTTTDGRDACGQQSAPNGTTFGTGNGSVAIVAPGNNGYNEYRISCNGGNLPDRKIALYR